LASAATVSYSGVLADAFGATNDDRVIAGTFVPGFDVNTYWWTFGDPVGNWESTHYTEAVSSGTFRPIGPGTLANAQGAFSGSGSTTGIDNLPIWIFMFMEPQPETSFYMALISSTDPSWRVQGDGVATIDTATANVFVTGSNSNGVIQLDFAPVPEPSATSVLSLAGMVMLRRKARRV
jgi:hypothetical protein